jgi:serine/threonine protein kinase/tetratricopeptide (TPR) repeat protein
MTPERWQQISAVFHAAQSRPAEARTSYLNDACAGDAGLREEVEALLREPSRLTGLFAGGQRQNPPADAPLIGQLIGPYRVVSLLGGGGMGRVYRARDTKLPRDVALKVLPAEFAANQDRRTRFEREAQALATLAHPHINKIFSVEDFGGQLALALELVEGESLQARLARGALPVTEALVLARQVAGALAAAHEKGVVHRDLKPGNIMISSGGAAQVLDFGLAKLLVPEHAHVSATAPLDPASTRTGMVVGTAAYMSPEQARGEEVDHRADVWAFGCLLYEMLTGRSPFQAGNMVDTLAAVLHKEPDWSLLSADLAPSLRTFLAGCLEKAQNGRFRDMVEGHRVLSLGSLVTDAVTPALAQQSSRWSARSVLVTAALVAARVGGLAVLRRPAAAGTPTSRINSIAVLPIQNLSGDPELEFVGDGTTEELISSLSQLRPLRVVARTSVMAYKASTKSAGEIARELGVDAVLEGAVRGTRGRLKITTHLVDSAGDSTLWSKNHEASMGDLLAVQEDIAGAVAAVVSGGGPSQPAAAARRRRTNPAAHEEILQGHALRMRNFDGDIRRSIAHYEKAIALDQDSAIAHASLALAWQAASGSAGIDETRAAATRALALDPDLPEAHAAMAAVHYRDWDWEAGHRESRRALALNPASLDGCYCFSVSLAWTGRDAEAVAVADDAVARNQRDAGAYQTRGQALYWGRQYEEAVAAFSQALQADQKAFVSLVLRALSLGRLNQGNEGVAQLDKAGMQRTTFTAIAMMRAGRQDEARRLLQELTSATPPVEANFMAYAYGTLGDKERALSWLTRAVDTRETRAAAVIDDSLDGLRTDPRFEALVRRMKMPASYYEFLRRKGVPASPHSPPS